MGTHDYPEDQWNAAKHEARQSMVAAARDKRVIFYDELVKEILSIKFGVYDAKFFSLLEQISREEHEEGRPILTTVAINRGYHRPGHGFFVLAKELGFEFEDEYKFWASQFW